MTGFRSDGTTLKEYCTGCSSGS